jgi:hypothetical protein
MRYVPCICRVALVRYLCRALLFSYHNVSNPHISNYLGAYIAHPLITFCSSPVQCLNKPGEYSGLCTFGPKREVGQLGHVSVHKLTSVAAILPYPRVSTYHKVPVIQGRVARVRQASTYCMYIGHVVRRYPRVGTKTRHASSGSRQL